jgi:1-aminocyclopropane-1-carboxylate deaminase
VLNDEPIIECLGTINGCLIDVLRLDLIDPEISGNKWYKLKHFFKRIKDENKQGFITFGGPHSNHILAASKAGKIFGFTSVGIIRGEQEIQTLTLKKASDNGMHLFHVSREEYSKEEHSKVVQNICSRFQDLIRIPEGGKGEEGVAGCSEILRPEWEYDFVLCACGTGTTFAGLLMSEHGPVIIGVNVLKGQNTLLEEVHCLCKSFGKQPLQFEGNEGLQREKIIKSFVTSEYAFGGYARRHTELLDFKKKFEGKYQLILDHVYTVKTFYACFDLIGKNKFKDSSRILVVHTGGLQGNEAFENRYNLNPNR